MFHNPMRERLCTSNDMWRSVFDHLPWYLVNGQKWPPHDELDKSLLWGREITAVKQICLSTGKTLETFEFLFHILLAIAVRSLRKIVHILELKSWIFQVCGQKMWTIWGNINLIWLLRVVFSVVPATLMGERGGWVKICFSEFGRFASQTTLLKGKHKVAV